MYHELAMFHIHTIKSHIASLDLDEKNYRDPSQFGPSNLGEIEHAVSELRRIAGAAAADLLVKTRQAA